MRKTQGDWEKKDTGLDNEFIIYVRHVLDKGLYKNDQKRRWGQKRGMVVYFFFWLKVLREQGRVFSFFLPQIYINLIFFLRDLLKNKKFECFNQNIMSKKCLYVCAMDHKALWRGQQSCLYMRDLFHSLFYYLVAGRAIIEKQMRNSSRRFLSKRHSGFSQANENKKQQDYSVNRTPHVLHNFGNC